MLDLPEDLSRRRRQDMYRHMAQHQEVAKLVAYAHWKGELPTVGPLLTRRPDYKALNERAQARSLDEERRLATLRARGLKHGGSRDADGEGAPLTSRSHAPSQAASAASLRSVKSASSFLSLSESTGRPPQRGSQGVGGGSTAARERVRERKQRSMEWVTQRSAAAPAPAMRMRRLRPYSTFHHIPGATTATSSAATLGSAQAPGASVASGSRAFRRSTSPARSPSPRRGRSLSPASRLLATREAGPTAPVGFGSRVPPGPTSRADGWSDRGLYWHRGEGADLGTETDVATADAARRRRADASMPFNAYGDRFARAEESAVGPHLGPGAYAQRFGTRTRDPWTPTVEDRLHFSTSFSSHEVGRIGAKVREQGDEDSVLPIAPDGSLVMPPGLLPDAFAQSTFASAAKAMLSPSTAAALGATGGRVSPARTRVTVAQRQRVERDLRRERLLAEETARNSDPVNLSVGLSARVVPGQGLRKTTLVALGGAPPPSGTGITPDSLTHVANKLLDSKARAG